MSIKKDIIQSIRIIILALILSVGVSYVFAEWTPPLSTPPNCEEGDPGCDPPIHVGTDPQVKNGDLSVLKFNANNTALFFGKVGIGTGSDVLDTSLTVKATGANGIKLAPEVGQTQNSGRLFFSNIFNGASKAFSILSSNQQLEFRYNAVPGSQSGKIGLTMSSSTNGSLVKVLGSIQIQDGTQGAGKVLTSDANGLASWTTPTGGTGGGITNIIGGTTNTINVTNTGTTVTIDADMQEICEALGGSWNTTGTPQCSGIGGTSSSGVSKIIAGNNVTITSTGTGGTGDVTINAVVPASAICTYGSVTYSTGVSCTTTKWTDGSGAHYKTQTCKPDGAWSPESGTQNGLTNPPMCGVGSGSASGISGITSSPGVNSSTNSNSIVVTGPTGPTANLAVNTNKIQSRVTGTCPSGQAIRTVGVDGTVTCQVVPTGGVSIGGGGWEGNANDNDSCLTDCTAWGGASCGGSSSMCNRQVVCPATYNKVMTGIWNTGDIGETGLFPSTKHASAYICYK